MTTFQNVWPVNELGEIVAAAGAGSSSITGFMNQDQIPVDSSGKVKIAGMVGVDASHALVTNGSKLTQSFVVASSFSPVIRTAIGDATDANFVTLASISIPPMSMGNNGVLRVHLYASTSATASATKTISTHFGTFNVGAPTMGNLQTSLGWRGDTFNTGTELAQKTLNIGSSPFGATSNGIASSSVDTRVAFPYDIKVKWSAATTAGDTITLLGYVVEAVYAP